MQRPLHEIVLVDGPDHFGCREWGLGLDDGDLRDAVLGHDGNRLPGCLARVHVDHPGEAVALAVEEVGHSVPARPQKAVIRHPLVVVQLGQIPTP